MWKKLAYFQQKFSNLLCVSQGKISDTEKHFRKFEHEINTKSDHTKLDIMVGYMENTFIPS